MPLEQERLTKQQWTVVLLIAAVQFINILDFVIVMPMGPEFAKYLHISEAHLGVVNGSYTWAAAITGLLGAFVLDRFDRRKALAVALFGLVMGTAAGAFATGLETLLLARVIAGAFGGPATSLSFSIISDVIPPKLRGVAMGTVMGAFSLASVVGVPLGLFMAELYGWRAPFVGVASVGVVLGAMAIFLLPPLTSHMSAERKPVLPELLALLKQPLVRQSYFMTALVMTAGFVLIPNITPYLQMNLKLPRESIKFAYFFGGFASFFATQGGGRLVDKFGSFRVGTVGTTLVVAIVFAFFFIPWGFAAPWVVYLAFVGFMLANGLRNVSYNTLTSKVPDPAVRARFQSMQSSVQHGASGMAASASALLLSTSGVEGSKRLEGFSNVAAVCMGLSVFVPVMLFIVERGVKARAAAAKA